MDIDNAMLYLDFVAARHHIWEQRQAGAPASEWTDDPILRRYKFTNVFRLLDPGSQYVIQMLQEPDLEPLDALARSFLYRYTNLPATWDHMRAQLGRWPLASDMTPELAFLIQDWRDAGNKVFSGAYVILPQPGMVGDKVLQAVELANRLFHPKVRAVPSTGYTFLAAKTQRERFDALRDNYGVGDFMAMQVLTDFGYYYPEDRENDFVVAGPGARRGAKAVDPKARPEDTIRWAQPLLTVQLPNGRRPSLMDVQNTFCEFGKYVRFMNRINFRDRPYVPAHPGAQPEPIIPAHLTGD